VRRVNSDICTAGENYRNATGYSPSVQYDIVDVPLIITPGEVFPVTVQIVSDEEKHIISLWSYLYRGSRSYSGDREENKQYVMLSPHEVRLVKLFVRTDDTMTPGRYLLKVKVQRDNRRTADEFTRNIIVVDENVQHANATELSFTSTAHEQFTSSLTMKEVSPFSTGVGVVRSSSKKAFELVPYFIIALLVFVHILLLPPHILRVRYKN
jgi:hypothetical protein